MTTTLIKTNNPTSKMFHLTGMESLSFKMVSILFIVILNVTNLSSQTSDPNSKVQAFTYASVNSLRETKPVFASARTKVYTVYIAKTFPTLESNAGQTLQAKNDLEVFDYDQMFSDSLNTRSANTTKIISLTVSKTTKKHSKNKVAPKLNS